MPCIRCGFCAAACPENLQPQQLLRDLRAGKLMLAREHGQLECSECGRCDAVCPSHIPLLQNFRVAIATLREREARTLEADAARERFERRQRRLEREAIERAERDSALAEQAASTDAVAAAIARAKAKRQQSRDST